MTEGNKNNKVKSQFESQGRQLPARSHPVYDTITTGEYVAGAVFMINKTDKTIVF